METRTLTDPAVSPSRKVLEHALGKAYSAYEDLMNTITGNNFELTPLWHYYNDGKAWLCKVQYKKKTVFWLSVWDKYFKMAFYFTEKNSKGIFELSIDDSIKKKPLYTTTLVILLIRRGIPGKPKRRICVNKNCSLLIYPHILPAKSV